MSRHFTSFLVTYKAINALLLYLSTQEFQQCSSDLHGISICDCRPPVGCLQYNTAFTGRITTFNFDGDSTHLANQQYSYCIRADAISVISSDFHCNVKSRDGFLGLIDKLWPHRRTLDKAKIATPGPLWGCAASDTRWVNLNLERAFHLHLKDDKSDIHKIILMI